MPCKCPDGTKQTGDAIHATSSHNFQAMKNSSHLMEWATKQPGLVKEWVTAKLLNDVERDAVFSLTECPKRDVPVAACGVTR